MRTAIGIDLGTSFSCVAAVRGQETVVFTDGEGRKTQPSVVAFGYGDTAVVGHRARRQMLYAPESTVASVKRLIGRRYRSEEVARVKSQSAYAIVEGEGGEVRIQAQGRLYSPVDISAHVLKHMKRIAEDHLGEVVEQAVITVPAYFNDNQRQETREAAARAGIECLRILNEPTAAALAYGFRQGKRQHIAVYDLGGGTFDISILRIDDDFFEVISTAGDTFLGGDDFDYVAADQFLQIISKQGYVEGSDHRTVRLKLRDAAERAKIALSTVEEVEIGVPALWRSSDGQEHSFKTRVDRYTYAGWVMPLVKRTLDVCEDALRNAGMTPRLIDHILMVGGMTRYPLIREAVTQFFGKPVNISLNPDEVVAMGAAIQAHNLTRVSEVPTTVLLDVTPQTLSVRTMGGFCEPLLPRNTPVPTEASKVFTTAWDDQAEVRIAVYQGESRMAAENELLGEVVLDKLPPRPRGQVRIKVSFEIDADGIVHVRAIDNQIGQERVIHIEARNAVPQEEKQGPRFDDIEF